MTAILNENSYAISELADHYFINDRINSTAWTGLNDRKEKDKALVTATTLLDTLNYIGCKASDTQKLQWPRNNPYDIDDYYNSYYSYPYGYNVEQDPNLDGETIPTVIIKATYELAYHLIQHPEVLDEVDQYETTSIGRLSVKGKKRANVFPGIVLNLIRDLLYSVKQNKIEQIGNKFYRVR